MVTRLPLKNLVIAHLVGTYVLLVVLFALLDGFCTPMPLIVALMMTPPVYLVALPFALPFALLSILLIALARQSSTWLFACAGLVSGLCTIALMLHLAPGLNEDRQNLIIAAGIGGAVAGYTFALMGRSTRVRQQGLLPTISKNTRRLISTAFRPPESSSREGP